MNTQNVGSFEACKRLVEAGIVLETVTLSITKRIMNAGGLNSGGPQLLIITGRKALHG